MRCCSPARQCRSKSGKAEVHQLQIEPQMLCRQAMPVFCCVLCWQGSNLAQVVTARAAPESRPTKQC